MSVVNSLHVKCQLLWLRVSPLLRRRVPCRLLKLTALLFPSFTLEVVLNPHETGLGRQQSLHRFPVLPRGHELE